MPSERNGDRRFRLGETLLRCDGVKQVEPLLTWPDRLLLIDATMVRRIDAYAAAVVRAAVERFVQRDTANSVWIERPHNHRARGFMCQLLGQLPSRAEFWGTEPDATEHRGVLLPTQRVHDHEARNEASRQLHERQRRYVSRGRTRPAQRLIGPFNELVANAFNHGPGSDVDVICAACVAPDTGNFQAVVLDTDPSVACCDDVEGRLREHVQRSSAERRAYFGMVLRDSPATALELLAGSAHLSWRDRIIASTIGGHLPGYLAALEVVL